MGSHHATQADLKLLDSSDPPALSFSSSWDDRQVLCLATSIMFDAGPVFHCTDVTTFGYAFLPSYSGHITVVCASL
jgi:hypothetical protein